MALPGGRCSPLLSLPPAGLPHTELGSQFPPERAPLWKGGNSVGSPELASASALTRANTLPVQCGPLLF